MGITNHVVDVAGAVGDSIEHVPELRAWVDCIVYEPDATDPYEVGATVPVSLVRSGGVTPEVIWTEVLSTAVVRRPRRPVHDSDGAVNAAWLSKVALALERLEVKVNGGGDGNTGRFVFIFERTG